MTAVDNPPLRQGAAGQLADALRPWLAGERWCACAPGTGRRPAPSDPELPLAELRTPDAVRRLLWHPGELGAAQAYVAGDLEVHPVTAPASRTRWPARGGWCTSAG
ncbi:MAG: hypothetical protein R2734_11815 [Nocardioides sp.]